MIRTNAHDRPVLITGPMRSGTSLVAQIVHRLGWPVSVTIPAPCPPSWRSDWEDPQLTTRLIRGQHIDWDAYVLHRRVASKALGFEGRVAIKSPYLVMRREKITESLRVPLWIKVGRREDARQRSLAIYPQLSRVHDAAIMDALREFKSDVWILYEALIESPYAATKELATSLGVTDEDTINAAAALIGQPTEYPCLL